MIKNLKFHRCGLWLICFFCASSVVFGQDLGSSNELFNSPNPKISKKTVKKTTSKKSSPATSKKTVSKSRSTIKTARSITKTTKPKKIVEISKSKPASIAFPPKLPPTSQNNVVIKVGQPTSPAENFDDLFENAIKEGNAARDERDYAKSEVAYLRAQSLKTKDSHAIYGLGNLFSDQQRWEEAERAYRTAIQIEPNSPEAYVALSFVLTQQRLTNLF